MCMYVCIMRMAGGVRGMGRWTWDIRHGDDGGRQRSKSTRVYSGQGERREGTNNNSMTPARRCVRLRRNEKNRMGLSKVGKGRVYERANATEGRAIGRRHPRRRANKYRDTHNRASKRQANSFMNPRKPRPRGDRVKGAGEEFRSNDGFSP